MAVAGVFIQPFSFLAIFLCAVRPLKRSVREINPAHEYQITMPTLPKTKKLDPDTTSIILESISDGVFTVDHNWEITSFNRAAEEITGIPREEAIGRHCWEVLRSNMCEHDCALKRTMKENKSFVSTSSYIINSQKKQIPITVSTSPLKDKNGEMIITTIAHICQVKPLLTQ